MSDLEGPLSGKSSPRPEPDPLPLGQVLWEEFHWLEPQNKEAAQDRVDHAANLAASGEGGKDRLTEFYQHIHSLPPRTALCLSGGGIRSATFGLGLIQGFARHGLLDKFDYLSTVSGGGYIGAWLSAWIRRLGGVSQVTQTLNRVPVPSPEGAGAGVANTQNLAQKIDPEPRAISHLRSYSNYLTPRVGLFSADTWALIATYVRNLLLNWLVLIPFLAALLLLPRIWFSALSWNPVPAWAPMLALIIAFAGAIMFMAYADVHRPSLVAKDKSVKKRREDEDHFVSRAFLPLLASSAAAVAFGIWVRHSPGFVQWVGWLPGSEVVRFGVAGIVIVLIAWLVHWRQLPGAKKWWEAVILMIVGFGGGALLQRLYAILAAPGHYPVWLQDGPVRHAFYACLALPLLLCVLFVFSTVLIGLVSGFTNDEDREWWARAAGWAFIAAIGWAAFSSLVLFGPYALIQAWVYAPKLVASVGGVAGIVTIFLGKSGVTAGGKTVGDKGQPTKTNVGAEIATALAAPLFATLLLALIALGTTVVTNRAALANWRADYTAKPSETPSGPTWRAQDYFQILEETKFWILPAAAAGALGVCGLMSLFVNVNKFSMHAMYRNRLTRAYLGASRSRKENLFADFQLEDNIDLKDLVLNGHVQRPFHVLSMALNLTSGSRLAWQNRKAESFTMSPLHAGSLRAGYRRVKNYSSIPVPHWARTSAGGGLTLGTAMTISGAAANPNMGYHSSPLVAFLLTMFNVRLGWWLGNPGKAGNKTYVYTSPEYALGPLFNELLGRSNNNTPYITLSDGGHFENLGLYEMVLRRCRLIVLSDAGEDPAYSFEDLSNALAKIQTDLGVPIEFTDQVPISRFEPEQAEKKDQLGGRYCAVGIIRYSAIDGASAPAGLLIYLKPTLIGQEPANLLHYARSNKAFPHEPTLDEFYSEAQFESYRVLGAHMVDYLCRGIEAKGDPGQGLLRFAKAAYAHGRRASETNAAETEIAKLLSDMEKRAPKPAQPTTKPNLI